MRPSAIYCVNVSTITHNAPGQILRSQIVIKLRNSLHNVEAMKAVPE